MEKEYIQVLRKALKEIKELAECNKCGNEDVFFRKIVEKANAVL